MNKIVVLTGAGISQESGLDTFRDANGIWAKYNMEEVCTLEGFKKNPEKLHEFYNQLRSNLPKYLPNAAHIALAKLEQAVLKKEIEAELVLITQNIDDLHERAGSRFLYHMHGELYKIRCTTCDRRMEWHKSCFPYTSCPYCHAVTLRPDIVWFGEMPYYMQEIGRALSDCNFYVATGTSGVVYPAARFVNEVQGRAKTIELNLEHSMGTSNFDESWQGSATELVPEFVNYLLNAYQK